MERLNQKANGVPVELPQGICLFHYCEVASFKDAAALFCGEAQKEVLDMTECPLGLWFKKNDGWPVERKIAPDKLLFPEPG
jgi:hypothetical protein